MGKKNVHDTTDKNNLTTAVPTCREDALAVVIQLFRQSLYFGHHDSLQPDQPHFDELKELLLYIQKTQEYLIALAQGNINEPVPIQGYTADLIKKMQENLRHIILKARQLAAGDIPCDAANVGELPDAFEVMDRTLQSVLLRLEQQQENLTELSENLRHEIDIRATMEESLRREQIRLQKLASTDPLTGIANRRQFVQTAVRELKRLRRTEGNACLAMLDIDYFKGLNDSLGHHAGDKALCRIAKIITSIVRPYDIVGRYGGDEFVFLLPEVTKENAYAILERVRCAVEKAKISTGRKKPVSTVSIGLTDLKLDKATCNSALDKAIMRADKALYKAKQKSRNSIFIL